MIQERKGSQLKEDDKDLFSGLFSANNDENLLKDEVKLNDSELIGKPRFNLLRDCSRTVTTFFRQYLHIDGRRA
jgi:hypothetical protein